MINFLKINIKLFLGFFLYGLAIVFMLNSNIGVGPWDAFHQGLSLKFGITVGQASIGIGLIIVMLDCILGESLGYGTITNMIFIGVFIDVVNLLGFVPTANTFITGLIMLLIGIGLVSIATVIYLSVGVGSGPRDGLMIALHRKTNKPIKVVRAVIELFALTMAFFLGGTIGIGTIISSFLLGYAIQIAFKIVKIDPKKIEHQSLILTLSSLKYELLSISSDKSLDNKESKNNSEEL